MNLGENSLFFYTISLLFLKNLNFKVVYCVVVFGYFYNIIIIEYFYFEMSMNYEFDWIIILNQFLHKPCLFIC